MHWELPRKSVNLAQSRKTNMLKKIKKINTFWEKVKKMLKNFTYSLKIKENEMRLSWSDLKQIDMEEAIRILYNNPCSSVGLDKTRPAVFYDYNGCPEALDIDGCTAEQFLYILHTYYLYTQDKNKGE